MQIYYASVALEKEISQQIMKWCSWSGESDGLCSLCFLLSVCWEGSILWRWICCSVRNGAETGLGACPERMGKCIRKSVVQEWVVTVCLWKVNGVSCANFYAINGLWESKVLMWPCHYKAPGSEGSFEVPTERCWPAYFHGNSHPLHIYNLWLKIQKGGGNLLKVTNV